MFVSAIKFLPHKDGKTNLVRAAPDDFDGDGRAAAVYQQSVWYISQTTSGFRSQLFGLAEDKPLSSEHLP